MLIYNTTFHVDGERYIGQFLTYMRDVYCPAIRAVDELKNPRLVRLLADVGENLIGYAMMFEVEDLQVLKSWKTGPGRELEADFYKTFGEKILTFSTSMKVVDKF